MIGNRIPKSYRYQTSEALVPEYQRIGTGMPRVFTSFPHFAPTINISVFPHKWKEREINKLRNTEKEKGKGRNKN